MMIREASTADISALMDLYTELHPGDVTPSPKDVNRIWREILSDERYRILVAEKDGQIVSSVTLIVVPNLTRGLRSYALIENVITRSDCRRQGFAGELMRRALEIAQEFGCYKVMLLTGKKDPATLRFYETCGFNSNDKTAFIYWIDE